MADPAIVQAMHPFEKAGLGKAPFHVVGVEIRRGPIEIQPGLFSGAPGQPMGCCAYCATGIAECWLIRSADGKVSVVGNECVRRTGQTRLVKEAAPHLRELRHAAEDRRIEAAKGLLQRPDVQHALDSMPAPEWARSETMLGYIEWLIQNAGNAGKIRAVRVIEKAAKT
jgi:hypothetical protein